MDDAPFRKWRFRSDKPNIARIYDYFLGGYANFAADRAAAKQIAALTPDAPDIMRANRAFLRRAVTFLVEQSITQFLDIGSGIPTVGNVHEIAQELNPAARVVYVDRDPIAAACSQQILQDNPRATAIQLDARYPEAILAHPEVHDLLDLDQPLGMLLVAVLHFIPDDAEAEHTIATLREHVAPGSYLAIAHTTIEGPQPEQTKETEQLYVQTVSTGKLRARAEIARSFAGLELVAPGLVYVPEWRSESADDDFLHEPARSRNVAGVARKLEP